MRLLKAIIVRYWQKWYYGELYNSLEEIPLYNWLKIQSGEFKYMHKKQRGFNAVSVLKYEQMYDEFIAEFGMPEELADMCDRMKAYVLAAAEYILNPNEPINYTNLEVARIEVDALKNVKKEEYKAGKFIASVEKYMGIPIDQKRLSAYDFYSKVALMKAEYKLQLMNNLK